MIGRITHIWAKPLTRWTLLDLVSATLLISLVSIACGFVLCIAAVIPAAVEGGWRKASKAEAQFTRR